MSTNGSRKEVIIPTEDESITYEIDVRYRVGMSSLQHYEEWSSSSKWRWWIKANGRIILGGYSNFRLLALWKANRAFRRIKKGVNIKLEFKSLEQRIAALEKETGIDGAMAKSRKARSTLEVIEEIEAEYGRKP